MYLSRSPGYFRRLAATFSMVVQTTAYAAATPPAPAPRPVPIAWTPCAENPQLPCGVLRVHASHAHPAGVDLRAPAAGAHCPARPMPWDDR